MPREDAIRVAGRVAEALSPRLFRVELANGHRVLAHCARRDADAAARLACGDAVDLEMSPFDMSRGRILFEKKL